MPTVTPRPLVLPCVNGLTPRWQVVGLANSAGRPVVSHHATRAAAEHFAEQHGGHVERYAPIPLPSQEA